MEKGFIIELDDQGNIKEISTVSRTDKEQAEVQAMLHRLLCGKCCTKYRKPMETRKNAAVR